MEGGGGARPQPVSQEARSYGEGQRRSCAVQGGERSCRGERAVAGN